MSIKNTKKKLCKIFLRHKIDESARKFDKNNNNKIKYLARHNSIKMPLLCRKFELRASTFNY